MKKETFIVRYTSNVKTSKILTSRFSTLCFSLRQSVSGQKERRRGHWAPLRYESAEESDHRSEEEDDRAYEDREAGAGGCETVTFLSHTSLCFPDGRQITFDIR